MSESRLPGRSALRGAAKKAPKKAPAARAAKKSTKGSGTTRRILDQAKKDRQVRATDTSSIAVGERSHVKRLSADLPIADAATLDIVAAQTGANKVTTLVRAIRVLAELVKAEDEGGQLVITYEDGRRERLRFL